MDLLRGYESSSDGEQMHDKRVSHAKLPKPTFIQVVATDANDDPSLHQGRVRTFPHERGIWASYVYVDCDSISDTLAGIYRLCQQRVSETLPVAELHCIDRFHISLTKTFTLRYHNIAPFADNLRDHFATVRRFSLRFNGITVYVNEERTRTFVALKVLPECCAQLEQLVRTLDECLMEYKQPIYYRDPSFHVSIAWCLGDQEQALMRHLPTMACMVEQFCEEEYGDMHISVRTLLFRFGNKLESFQLVQ